MKKYVVGLTGGIGSGKSTITKIFSSLGVPVIDEDQISRIVIKNRMVLSQISCHFGSEMFLENGNLNRAKLRKKIFDNQMEKIWLDHLLHPIIKKYTILNLSLLHTNSYILLVSPVFIERDLQKLVNRLLVVDADPITQISRVVDRDKVSSKHVEDILSLQISQTERLTYADDVIRNEGKIENLINKILHLHKYYIKMSRILRIM